MDGNGTYVSPESPTENLVSISRTEEPECQMMMDSLDFSIDIRTFKQFVNEIATFSTDCKVKVDPAEGLKVRIVDPAHISMCDTGIAREVFDTFSLSPANAYVGVFGLDVEKLQKYLKGQKGKDTIFRVNVNLTIRKLTIDGPDGTRTMNLLDDCEMSDPRIPELNLPTDALIHDAKAFRQALKAASQISNYVAIRYEANTSSMWLECEGESDQMKARLDVSIERSEDSRSLFPLEYLSTIARLLPDGFHLELGTDYPLKLRYGRTQILLAPRIESND